MAAVSQSVQRNSSQGCELWMDWWSAGYIIAIQWPFYSLAGIHSKLIRRSLVWEDRLSLPSPDTIAILDSGPGPILNSVMWHAASLDCCWWTVNLMRVPHMLLSCSVIDLCGRWDTVPMFNVRHLLLLCCFYAPFFSDWETYSCFSESYTAMINHTFKLSILTWAPLENILKPAEYWQDVFKIKCMISGMKQLSGA